jgi:ATP-binding cassette subfamily B protein
MGILFQDYNAYSSLTVKENVEIDSISNNVTEKTVKEALKKANALEFIEKYKDGVNQILSERYKGGIRPSTGQWQKIAIARVFHRGAPVLILDEPTASIDAVAEAKIFDNIYKFAKDKTVIIISHRFSTVRNADRIIVLDKGRIIEQGSHEELLKNNGKYARAFKLQAKGYQ